jgi:hypothetical protein
VIIDRIGNKDRAGLGEGLQSRRDIHTVAEDIVTLCDHVAKIDADAELYAFFRRSCRVALGHSPLHLNRAAHRVHHALELGEEAVSGVLDHPPAVLGDLGVNQLPEVCLQPLVRPLLIRPHQARVSRHVGGADRGEATDGRHRWSVGWVALTKSTLKPAPKPSIRCWPPHRWRRLSHQRLVFTGSATQRS